MRWLWYLPKVCLQLLTYCNNCHLAVWNLEPLKAWHCMVGVDCHVNIHVLYPSFGIIVVQRTNAFTRAMNAHCTCNASACILPTCFALHSVPILIFQNGFEIAPSKALIKLLISLFKGSPLTFKYLQKSSKIGVLILEPLHLFQPNKSYNSMQI